ncbi:hypothetical protein MRX96_042439 [Rhipicephalus microplus]
MGKTPSILITFDAHEIPHSTNYMEANHSCNLYRGIPDAYTNCRLPGHRHDVCPSPKTNLCPRCGIQHPLQEPPCTIKCILCEGFDLISTGSCKKATFTSHANRQGNLKRSDKNQFRMGTTSSSGRRGPLSLDNTS